MGNRTGRPRGRPRYGAALKKTCLGITAEQMRLLRVWGRGNASEGLRWLIDQARALVRRAQPPGGTAG